MSGLRWRVYWFTTNLLGWLLAPLLDPSLWAHDRVRLASGWQFRCESEPGLSRFEPKPPEGSP